MVGTVATRSRGISTMVMTVEYLPLLLTLGETMAIEFDSVLSDEDLANIRHHIIERERNYIEELDVVLDAYYNLREQIKRDGEK